MFKRGLLAVGVSAVGLSYMGARDLLAPPKFQLPQGIERICGNEIRRAVERCYEDPLLFNTEPDQVEGAPSAAQDLRDCLDEQTNFAFLFNCSRPDPYMGGHFYLGGQTAEKTWRSSYEEAKLSE